MLFCDAHLHINHIINCYDTIQDFFKVSAKNLRLYACSTALEPNEFNQNENFSLFFPKGFKIIHSFGIHPWYVSEEKYCNIDFLEKLLSENRIHAVGECGFDFFTPELRETEQRQRELFEATLELAIQYSRPLVIHDRKAAEPVFRYSPELKKLPAVVFHAFPFGAREAEVILSKNVNAYFSFGKNLLRKSSRNIKALQGIQFSRILAETDSPYGRIGKEKFTPVADITKVYESISDIRKVALEELGEILHANFCAAYGIQTASS